MEALPCHNAIAGHHIATNVCTCHNSTAVVPWASCQIRKNTGCACAGNAGNVFPRRRFQRKLLYSDPGMHHGTCVTHVPWCMSGSLTCGDGENVPGIPGACASAILRIWQEAHVQNFVAITVLELRWVWNEISIEFELRWKNCLWNGPQLRHNFLLPVRIYKFILWVKLHIMIHCNLGSLESW